MWEVNENIKFNNLDINLKINLGDGKHLLGYQQEIDNLTELTKQELINPVIDGETRRFKYEQYGNATYLSFYFYAGAYGCTFADAGFSSVEISTLSSKVLNSFYIMELYDTFDPYTQTKISTNYLTKILTNAFNGTPKYTVNVPSNNQFNDLYIPQSFLDAKYGVTMITGYTKFSFYNAKTGRISLFYNSGNTSMLTPEKLYFKVRIDTYNKTWSFIGSASPNPTAVEMLPNNAYVQRVNDTINNTENKKQNYPVGEAFDKNTGTYIIE